MIVKRLASLREGIGMSSEAKVVGL
jgi:hypothetical protein